MRLPTGFEEAGTAELQAPPAADDSSVQDFIRKLGSMWDLDHPFQGGKGDPEYAKLGGAALALVRF